jgi:hypothetical protein
LSDLRPAEKPVGRELLFFMKLLQNQCFAAACFLSCSLLRYFTVKKSTRFRVLGKNQTII